MNLLFDQKLCERASASGVVAVVILDLLDDAEPLAEALLAGGVDAIELTLRTPVAMDALRAIKKKFPEMMVGAGTVLTPDQVSEVAHAGCDFAVSPGVNPRVLEAARTAGLSFAPGIATASDIEQALEFDARLLKFFPAAAMGGLKYLKNLAAPYAHLGLKFIPLGGVGPDNMADYLHDPLIAAVGGSWLAGRAAIAAKNWGAITKAAREARVLAPPPADA